MTQDPGTILVAVITILAHTSCIHTPNLQLKWEDNLAGFLLAGSGLRSATVEIHARVAGRTRHSGRRVGNVGSVRGVARRVLS